MKAALKLLVLSILLTSGGHVFSQNQEKWYYDESWKGSSADKASFYRLVTLDNTGTPIGLVKDFYITGELQMSGEAISVDKSSDDKSKWKKTIGYHKSGRKSSCTIYDTTGNSLENFNWLDEQIASFSYFENQMLNLTEALALKYSNHFFNEVVAGNNLYNFYIDIKKAQNETGGDSFSLFDSESKHQLGWISYTVEKEFYAAWSDASEVDNVETELTNKEFKLISKINEKDPETGKVFTKTKWGKENYPYRYILKYSENKKNNVIILLVSNITAEY